MHTHPTSVLEMREKLASAGLKATPQRLAIFAIVQRAQDHPTAEQIYRELSQTHPGISLGTVYKTMDSFVEAGLIRKVKTGDDVLRFDAKVHPHSHLYCLKTNRILDFEDEELEKLLEEYFAKKGIDNFRISEVQVQISGELLENTKAKK